MIHFTTLITNMFNGVSHSYIGIGTKENEFKLIWEFGYKDFKGGMS